MENHPFIIGNYIFEMVGFSHWFLLMCPPFSIPTTAVVSSSRKVEGWLSKRAQDMSKAGRSDITGSRQDVHRWVHDMFMILIAWVFPKIGLPTNHPFNRDFHYKPSILGYHYFWKHPPRRWFQIFFHFHPENGGK